MTVKNDIYEFPEDDNIVPLKMEYVEEFLKGSDTTTRSTMNDDPPNQTFRSALLVVLTLASALFFGAFVTRFSPFLGSLINLGTLIVFHEWHRVYGSLLTPKIRASINYGTLLKSYKEFIPCYDMAWLFGGKYSPYRYGCTGPSLNPDMERTPDDPESRSPTKSRGDEKLKKDF